MSKKKEKYIKNNERKIFKRIGEKMISNNSIILIGLGHRARNGKDAVASFIQNHILSHHSDKYDCKIIHFADALYKECQNKEFPKYPLIDFNYDTDVFYIQDKYEDEFPLYRRIDASNPLFEKLSSFWIDEDIVCIDSYFGMDKKTPKLLQLWGTDYRRKLCGENYWRNKLDDKLTYEILAPRTIFSSGETCKKTIILLPDTRFINELDWVRYNGGKYILVTRFNEDDTQYIDPNRNPNHQSEIDLCGVVGDYYISTYSGDMKHLEEESIKTIEMFLEEFDGR